VGTARASATFGMAEASGTTVGVAQGVLISLSTAVLLLAFAVAVLFTPLFMHPALDQAGSATWLGVGAGQAHQLSDQTVAEVLLGPATFTFTGPDGARFYDADEAAHLRDVRLVLGGFVLVALLAGGLLAISLARGWNDRSTWAAVARGGLGLAVGMAVVGAVAVIAFDAVFEVFHRILFAGGNWSFDPTSQRLVQLYPLSFWQLAAAGLGVLTIGGGLLTWAIARRRARGVA
jgi:integral membrane protein (TIGR01906 family)